MPDSSKNERHQKPTVAVAGASGFIGGPLPDAVGDDFRWIGLDRSIPSSDTPSYDEWRQTDLFSRQQSIDALAGAEMAVYLVHSLHPSATLTQGEIGDLDLICADNFARAARHHGIEHIVYVSPLITGQPKLSDYLASRRDIERALRSHGADVTILRTSMVIGPGGRSTQILSALVDRLPAMLLPRWAESRLAPVARRDLIDYIGHYLQHRPPQINQEFEISGPQITTFREMLEIVAHLTRKNRRIRSLPLNFTRLSTAWMSFWTGQPRRIVRPMVDGLLEDRVPTAPPPTDVLERAPTPLVQALNDSLSSLDDSSPRAHLPPPKNTELARRPQHRDVRAVHRLTLPQGRDMPWLADEYRRWLPSLFRPFIHVTADNNRTIRFFLRPLPWPLMTLDFDHSVSANDRQLYWIRSGLLATDHERGRLEFRSVLDDRHALAAIHEFHPRLPWLIYRHTQARIHHLVMTSFNRHLEALPADP